jgi:hypothetical protein
MRILGIFNILYCISGVYYFAAVASWHWDKLRGYTSGFEWFIFAILFVISLSLVGAVGYLGVRAFAGDKLALKLLAIVFAAELAYFVVDVVVFWLVLPPSMDHVVLGLWEAPEDLLAPQIITGYPLLGIIVSLILHFRSRPKLAKAASGDEVYRDA